MLTVHLKIVAAKQAYAAKALLNNAIDQPSCTEKRRGAIVLKRGAARLPGSLDLPFGFVRYSCKAYMSGVHGWGVEYARHVDDMMWLEPASGCKSSPE